MEDISKNDSPPVQHARDVRQISTILRLEYGDFAHNNRKNPLDELLFIICSTKTTGISYENTYTRFRHTFRRFKDIASANEQELANMLSSGGLQNIKAKAIRQIMCISIHRFGRPTLSPLRHMNDDDCERFLTSLPGVGRKIARCVMMYSLGRPVFPVDTHCWRISQRIGWIRPSSNSGSCTPKDMDLLQEIIPEDLRFSLHVNMVSLGKKICIYHEPKCRLCPISKFCNKYNIDIRD